MVGRRWESRLVLGNQKPVQTRRSFPIEPWIGMQTIIFDLSTHKPHKIITLAKDHQRAFTFFLLLSFRKLHRRLSEPSL